MIRMNDTNCPACGGKLIFYDNVKRALRTKNRITNYIDIRRLRCTECKRVHRELPEDVLPYKRYEAEVVYGVVEGLITCETLGFEDYPCELTMQLWISQQIHGLL